MAGRRTGTRVIKCECGGRVTGPAGSNQECRYCGKQHRLPEGERVPPPATKPADFPIRLIAAYVVKEGRISLGEIYRVAYPDNPEAQQQARAANRYRSLIIRTRQLLERTTRGKLERASPTEWVYREKGHAG